MQLHFTREFTNPPIANIATLLEKKQIKKSSLDAS